MKIAALSDRYQHAPEMEEEQEIRQIKSLMYAVLIQAIKDLRQCKEDFENYRLYEYSSLDKNKNSAFLWFMADNYLFFGFVNICLILGFDPQATRTAILQFLSSDRAKKRQKREKIAEMVKG